MLFYGLKRLLRNYLAYAELFSKRSSLLSWGGSMLPVTQKLKYFLYVRKSTDVEDKQVLSIAAQIAELKEFAARMEKTVRPQKYKK